MEGTVDAIFVESQDSSIRGYSDLGRLYRESLELAASKIKEKRIKAAQRLRILKSKAQSRGLRQGLSKAQELLESKLKQCEQLHDSLILHANRDCLNLALKIAAEITESMFNQDTTLIARKISKELKKLQESQGLIIYVHPAQLNLIKKHFPDDLRLAASADIAPGDAVIETTAGSLELNWRSRLDLAKAQLFSRLYQEIFALAKAPNAASYPA